MRRLPNKTTRQTLLFSATMPTDVRAIASLALSENYAFVDTVGEDANTHAHVPQTAVVCSPGQEIAVLASLLTSAKKADPTGYKHSQNCYGAVVHNSGMSQAHYSSCSLNAVKQHAAYST
eukprot:3088-Heterococcus_DN1.PRE.1